MAKRTCTYPGCSRPHEAFGYCRLHYRRWKKYGDAGQVAHIIGDDVARFWSKVDRSGGPDACWPWLSKLDAEKYGVFLVGNPQKDLKAHRYAYELSGRALEAGQPLDHECHTNDSSCPGGKACLHRRCVNPAHLAPVSTQENNRRAAERRTTFRCGHPTTPENVYTFIHHGVLTRRCRICSIAKSVIYNRKRRATARDQ